MAGFFLQIFSLGREFFRVAQGGNDLDFRLLSLSGAVTKNTKISVPVGCKNLGRSLCNEAIFQ